MRSALRARRTLHEVWTLAGAPWLRGDVAAILAAAALLVSGFRLVSDDRVVDAYQLLFLIGGSRAFQCW